MQSDILILVKIALDDAGAETVTSAIYRATRTALVTRNPSNGRTFLVRFDPETDTSTAILGAVRGAGFDAAMAMG